MPYAAEVFDAQAGYAHGRSNLDAYYDAATCDGVRNELTSGRILRGAFWTCTARCDGAGLENVATAWRSRWESTRRYTLPERSGESYADTGPAWRIRYAVTNLLRKSLCLFCFEIGSRAHGPGDVFDSGWHHSASVGHPVEGLVRSRDTSDDLDFEVETGKKVYADRSPVRKWSVAERPFANRLDGLELPLQIGMERGDVDNIVEGTTSGLEYSGEIVEGKLNLFGEIGLGRAVLKAADLPGHEQQIACTDSRRIAVILVKSLPSLRGNYLSLGHDLCSGLRESEWRPTISRRSENA